jgi:hypothetical protein
LVGGLKFNPTNQLFSLRKHEKLILIIRAVAKELYYELMDEHLSDYVHTEKPVEDVELMADDNAKLETKQDIKRCFLVEILPNREKAVSEIDIALCLKHLYPLGSSASFRITKLAEGGE